MCLKLTLSFLQVVVACKKVVRIEMLLYYNSLYDGSSTFTKYSSRAARALSYAPRAPFVSFFLRNLVIAST